MDVFGRFYPIDLLSLCYNCNIRFFCTCFNPLRLEPEIFIYLRSMLILLSLSSSERDWVSILPNTFYFLLLFSVFCLEDILTSQYQF